MLGLGQASPPGPMALVQSLGCTPQLLVSSLTICLSPGDPSCRQIPGSPVLLFPGRAQACRVWVAPPEPPEPLRHPVPTPPHREHDVLFPGYTHLQRAQPIRWSHWILR